MTERPVPQAPLKQRREQIIAVLCDHFARDHLELEEFEARLDRAHRAATLADLDALTQDLPAVRQPAAEAAPRRDALARTGSAALDALAATRTMLAIMGGVERKGRWTPARRNLIVAVMGGAELDFREVLLPPGTTEVHVFCMMGGVEIIVPPGLAVDASGFAIMGGFGHSAERRGSDPDAPVLRVTGFCLMGGVEVIERLPGESAGDARRRQKEERRQLREQRRLRGDP
jgi:hypothetical protein